MIPLKHTLIHTYTTSYSWNYLSGPVDVDTQAFANERVSTAQIIAWSIDISLYN
jgi:hypothetical protein